jgi:2-hydroxychromene-2-carboxylate isomerase
MSSIDFYFDVGSPYSYLAATQIDAVARKHGNDVSWRPFLLGAVFKATGNEMPARVPAKAKWMLADLGQWAELYNVPFQFPASFPPNTVRAMRACCVAETKGKARAFAMPLFSGYWTRGVDPSSDEGLGLAATAAGLDPAEVLAAVETQPVKDALRANTDRAIAAGAFGAPAMVFEGKLLWGNDRLALLDHLLAKAHR